MTDLATLPRWDLTPFFPSLDSEEFRSAFERVSPKIEAMAKLFAENEIDTISGPTTDEVIAKFESLLPHWNALTAELRVIGAFISAHTTTDSRNETALSFESQYDRKMALLRTLGKRLTAWVGSLDKDSLLAKSSQARDHEFWVSRSEISARHLMNSDLEALASEMELTGSSSWSKLHGTVSSQIDVTLELNGEQATLPITAVRAMAYDANRAVRIAAFEAELAAWKTVETPLAAAMNGIKGEVSLLSKRRGWKSPLEESLFVAYIDQATLDAMFGACQEFFPVFRRYLNAKAKAIGVSKLAFYDLFAPLGASESSWDYHEATEFVTNQFRTYSDRLGDFAARAFRENWVDVAPRSGKRGGAYCMGFRGDESRVFMNYKPSFSEVSTLAHELGHAYHNVCLANGTTIQRATPMTLAETASIFCETIVREAVLENGDDNEKLTVLEASLQGSTQVVVDIYSRFLFEADVFEGRSTRGDLSARELCDLMTKAQLNSYGDGLDSETLHPYMWAVKPHYYSRSFYNFPYCYGLLFGLGLYAIYLQDPEPFRARYDDLLASTGSADAASLANRFGIDVTSPEFWRASLRQIEDDVVRFEALIG